MDTRDLDQAMSGVTEIERDADLAEFRGILRRVLERHSSESSVPSDAAGGAQSPAGSYDHQLWTLVSHQIGVAGLAVPEKYGGSGGGYLECHLVLEELGRAVVASPFLASSVLATQALLLAGDEAVAAELLPDLAAGTRTAALILGAGSAADQAGEHASGMLTATGLDPLRATDTHGSWTIDGRARHVLDGARADVLLAFAQPHPKSRPLSQPDGQTMTGPALFLLDTKHPGLRRHVVPTMDQTLHLAEIHCTAVPARRLSGRDVEQLTGPTRSARVVPSRLADLAATAITAEQVGGARRCLELTVEYAKHRVQFGRPIGSFQAIKHRLADLLVLVESADSASHAAAQAWADNADDASALASLAKSYCSEAYRAVAAETIQLHGGIGFTWEHQAHRYFKRAHSTSALFGDPSYHRQRLAHRLGLIDPSNHADGDSLL